MGTFSMDVAYHLFVKNRYSCYRTHGLRIKSGKRTSGVFKSLLNFKECMITILVIFNFFFIVYNVKVISIFNVQPTFECQT